MNWIQQPSCSKTRLPYLLWECFCPFLHGHLVIWDHSLPMAKFLSQLCNTGFTALDEGLYFSSLQKYFPVKFWSPEKTKNYQLENYNYCHETLKMINLLSKEKCLYLLNCIKEIWIVISVTTALEFQRSPCCERERKKKENAHF